MTAAAPADAALAAAAPVAAAPASSRWLALDALRGLTIAAMILVNNPGDWGHIYAPLEHARWHGCTFTDLIFPTFLFVVGAAIVPATTRQLQRGRSPRQLLPHIGRRTATLLLLGMLLSAFPLLSFADGTSLFAPLLAMRFPGVLQRIAVCYAIAALLFLYTTPRAQLRVLVGCLLLYWPLLALCPTPDGGAPDLSTQGDHLAGWLDRTAFGRHIWVKGQYDPEGLLSTIPAVGTTLLGVAAGRVLAGAAPLAAKLQTLLLRAVLLMALGAVWGWFLPINKALWTSSYVLWTGGIATAALGLSVWAFELQPWQRWARPLQIYGVNALLVFVGSGLLGRLFGRLITVTDADGKVVSLQRWFYHGTLARWFDAYDASLLYALLWVTGWFVVLWLLWRRGIVWKV